MVADCPLRDESAYGTYDVWACGLPRGRAQNPRLDYSPGGHRPEGSRRHPHRFGRVSRMGGCSTTTALRWCGDELDEMARATTFEPTRQGRMERV